MTPEQQSLADRFTQVIEVEYELCVREILKSGKAIVELPDRETQEYRQVNLTNQEIDSICRYWQNRLYCLFDWLSRKDFGYLSQLEARYRNTIATQTDWLQPVRGEIKGGLK